jgi:hypothetical protein
MSIGLRFCCFYIWFAAGPCRLGLSVGIAEPPFELGQVFQKVGETFHKILFCSATDRIH